MGSIDFTAFIQNWDSVFYTAVFVAIIYFGSKFILDKQKTTNEGNTVLRSVLLFCIVLIGFIMIILALPMEQSLKGQITSLIGIVIAAVLSLGSATFFGNLLAGVLLRSINNFKIGDFIRVGDTFGRVSERGLFHTEVQTEDRDLITLPNLLLANNPVKVISYSGTFISATCSLGYDVHHSFVKKVLIRATEQAGLEDGFVLVKELGDFSIVYQVLGRLKDAKTIISAKSKLNSAMLDCLHDVEIEIVSPGFVNQRQVNEDVFIPKKIHFDHNEPTEVESMIFDKADKAEDVQKSKETIGDVEDKLKILRIQLKDAVEETDKVKIGQRIEKFTALLERMKMKIEDKIEKLDKE